MTDKQIIIDGVDVNALYSEQIACMNRYEVARLFIKTVELLVSKEQECERLEEIIQLQNKMQMEVCEEKNKELDQLKTENEALKKAIEYDSRYNDLQAEIDCGETIIKQLKAENDGLKEEYWKLEQGNDFLAEKNSKLKQTLTEIKEIADIINDRTMVASYICDHLDKILQKISECEGNDENN